MQLIKLVKFLNPIMVSLFTMLSVFIFMNVSVKAQPQNNADYNKLKITISYCVKNKNVDSINKTLGALVQNGIALDGLPAVRSQLKSLLVDIDSDSLDVIVYTNLARVATHLDNGNRLSYLQKALQIIETKNILRRKRTDILMQMANEHIAKNNFFKASQKLKGIRFSDVSDSIQRVDLLVATGLLHIKLGDTALSVKLFNDALAMGEAMEDDFAIASAYSALATYHNNDTKDYTNVINLSRKEFYHFAKAGYPQYTIASLGNIGLAYTHLAMYDSASFYLNRAYDEAKRINNKYEIPIILREKAFLELKLNRPMQSIDYSHQALSIQGNRGSAQSYKSLYHTLSNAYEALGRFDSAYFYRKKFEVFKDSIFSLEDIKAVSRFQAEKDKQKLVEEQAIKDIVAKAKIRNRNIILGFLSALIALLFLLVYQIKKSAQRKKEQAVIVAREQEQIRFSQDLLNSLEEEKTRVSRELHDSIGQNLILIKNYLKTENYTSVDDLASKTLSDVRSIAQDLHPFVLEKLGLTAAMNKLVDEIDKSTEIFVTSEIENIDAVLNDQQKVNVYRAFQEVLGNVIKHAQTDVLHINCRRNDHEVILSIQDFGKGFAINDQDPNYISLGLKTLQERARMLNAKFSIDSIVKKGTKVEFLIPIANA